MTVLRGKSRVVSNATEWEKINKHKSGSRALAVVRRFSLINFCTRASWNVKEFERVVFAVVFMPLLTFSSYNSRNFFSYSWGVAYRGFLCVWIQWYQRCWKSRSVKIKRLLKGRNTWTEEHFRMKVVQMTVFWNPIISWTKSLSRKACDCSK